MKSELIQEQTDLRLFLQQELVARCKANPKYSLRAFARKLKLEPSYLSKILAGKRTITKSLVNRVSQCLGLSPDQHKAFIESLGKEISALDSSTKAKPSNYHQLTVDTYVMISDWYHYAILELLSLDGFEANSKNISAKLGISVIEAQSALERLERLEMIGKDAAGRIVNVSGSNTTVGNEFTIAAFRKLQKQILEQAIDAIEEIPMEERDHSSMTMAIHASLLPEAKKHLKEFRRKFCAELQSSPLPKDSVYQLALAFFPVTKQTRSPS